MSKKRAGRAKLDLEAMVGAGETSAYEALELYKSRANRLQLKNEFDQGLDALSKGAICMIQHSYFTCAEVLCDLFVEMLSESGSKLTPDVRSIIKSIEESFACAGIATKHKFLCDCVRWSIETGDRKFGDPILQARLGTCKCCLTRLWRRFANLFAIKVSGKKEKSRRLCIILRLGRHRISCGPW